MNHFPWYSTDVLYKDSNIILGRSHYVGYPSRVFEDEKCITVIEGCMYNKSDRAVKEDLIGFSLSNLTPTELVEHTRRFISKTDGEFIVVKYDKQKGSCLIFNDALGRLPFYYSHATSSPTSIVMSRELKFVIPFLADLYVDKTALADYLLFGYSLGDRTLWKNIRRLPFAAMIMMDIEKKGLVLRQALSWNLDPRDYGSKNGNRLHEKTGRLVDLFTSSLKGIAGKFSEGYTQVVSLSGGLDSRATLAGLRQIGMSPVAFSYPSREIHIARDTAKALKVDHYTISSSYELSDEDYVKLTDGLLDIGLRPLLSYLYGIREKAGEKAILYTGDGGDKTLGPLHLGSGISNLQELVSYIIDADHIFDLDEVSSMLNVDENDLRSRIESHLTAYHEDTMEGKFLHFKVFERGFKWLFVGEDRNRVILWSTTPFYSIRFFTSSTEESQSTKEHYALYKDFLLNLNPILTQIPYYNRLIPLSAPDWLLKLYLTAFEWFKRHLYFQGASNPIVALMGEPTQRIPDATRRKILQLLNQKGIFDFLDSSRVRRQILSEKNQMKLNLLATLILHVNLATHRSLLETSSDL